MRITRQRGAFLGTILILGVVASLGLDCGTTNSPGGGGKGNRLPLLVKGSVKDQEGSPIPNAVVRLAYMGQLSGNPDEVSRIGENYVYGELACDEKPHPLQKLRLAITGKTDGQGRFSLRGGFKPGDGFFYLQAVVDPLHRSDWQKCRPGMQALAISVAGSFLAGSGGQIAGTLTMDRRVDPGSVALLLALSGVKDHLSLPLQYSGKGEKWGYRGRCGFAGVYDILLQSVAAYGVPVKIGSIRICDDGVVKFLEGCNFSVRHRFKISNITAVDENGKALERFWVKASTAGPEAVDEDIPIDPMHICGPRVWATKGTCVVLWGKRPGQCCIGAKGQRRLFFTAVDGDNKPIVLGPPFRVRLKLARPHRQFKGIYPIIRLNRLFAGYERWDITFEDRATAEVTLPYTGWYQVWVHLNKFGRISNACHDKESLVASIDVGDKPGLQEIKLALSVDEIDRLLTWVARDSGLIK